MPPKQQPKADLAKKQKIVEDKTFGLKNKNKSKNVQKYVQSLQQSVQPKPDTSKIATKKKKEEDKVREKELNDLFKIAVSQLKVPVDENQTMEDWDQETLEKVVESKKEYNQNKPTDIVCKYFLEAVEKKQYGWFWVCPNGGKDCHYRHALPPGYLLKSQMKALLEEETEKITIEEDIENQRAKVTSSIPLTPELFMQWKKKRMEEREAGLAAQQAERAKHDRMRTRHVDNKETNDQDWVMIITSGALVLKLSTCRVLQVKDDPASQALSTSTATVSDVEALPDDDDDDELDMDELNELEASLSRTSIQNREPGIEASS